MTERKTTSSMCIYPLHVDIGSVLKQSVVVPTSLPSLRENCDFGLVVWQKFLRIFMAIYNYYLTGLLCFTPHLLTCRLYNYTFESEVRNARNDVTQDCKINVTFTLCT